MPKNLTDEELEDIKNWLRQHEISYKNIHRDFSDALLAANLLKKLYPKIVELNNYRARNSTQSKLYNWETLNVKVLAKLGLHQNKKMLEQLSKATPGAIEALLKDIMLVHKAKKSKAKLNVEPVRKNEVLKVTVNKKIGDNLVQVPEKMILYSLYERAEKISQEKDNVIQAADQKILHLENLIKIKTERIDELCAQLAKESLKRVKSDQIIYTSEIDSEFERI